MSEQRTIRAAEGRRVRHPGTKKLLDPAGEAVTWSSYWERLRTAGDIEKVPAKAPASPPAPPAPKTKDGSEQ